jgi:hypothetical protein
MPLHDGEHYANLHAIRQVVADPYIDKFLAAARETGIEVFGPKDSALVREPLSDETMLSGETPARGANVPWDVYAPSTLKLTLFERRAHVSEGMGRTYQRAQMRLLAPRYEIDSDNED